MDAYQIKKRINHHEVMRDFYCGNDRQKKVWQKEINRKKQLLKNIQEKS